MESQVPSNAVQDAWQIAERPRTASARAGALPRTVRAAGASHGADRADSESGVHFFHASFSSACGCSKLCSSLASSAPPSWSSSPPWRTCMSYSENRRNFLLQKRRPSLGTLQEPESVNIRFFLALSADSTSRILSQLHHSRVASGALTPLSIRSTLSRVRRAGSSTPAQSAPPDVRNEWPSRKQSQHPLVAYASSLPPRSCSRSSPSGVQPPSSSTTLAPPPFTPAASPNN